MSLKLAILYWYYHKPELTSNRIRYLRKHNPETAIYGLYGGDPTQAKDILQKQAALFDDLYCYPYEKSARWKWTNGDLLIVDWFKKRGRHFKWDTLVICQWDMMLAEPVSQLFRTLKPNQLLLSNFRPIKEIEDSWQWTKPEHKRERQLYEGFQRHLKVDHEYEGEVFACLFLVACLPRTFLADYSNQAHPDYGYVEYRFPTLARAMGYTVKRDKRYDAWWYSDDNTPYQPVFKRFIVATGDTIPSLVILFQFLFQTGARVFHPVHRPFPTSYWCTFQFLCDTRLLKSLGTRILRGFNGRENAR